MNVNGKASPVMMRSGSAMSMVQCLALGSPILTLHVPSGIILANKTRQGYARKRNLKLAGYFFSGLRTR